MTRSFGCVSVLFLCLASGAYGREDHVETVGYSGQWGIWGDWHYCPQESFASGYSMKVEPDQGGGGGDDTAVNGIKLYCTNRASGERGADITSTQGPWGWWREGASCSPSTFLKSSSMKFEEYQGGSGSDDTATNSVNFKCTDGNLIQASGTMPWGEWGPFATCPDKTLAGMSFHTAICGIQTRVEPDLKNEAVKGGDDTALNGANYACCILLQK